MIIQEIPYQNPLVLFSSFSNQVGAIFFDSAQPSGEYGRYSFIAIDPFSKLVSKNGCITLNGATLEGDPFSVLGEELLKYTSASYPDLPPFQGGAAGFFSYDLCHHVENIPAAKMDDMQFPDMVIGFYDLVMGFDHVNGRAWILSQGYPELNSRVREVRAKKRIDWLLRQLAETKLGLPFSDVKCKEDAITSYFNGETYTAAVRKVRDYILAGDIFEANISQRFQVELPHALTPFDLYQRLRLCNPAPFSAYVNAGDTIIASASPERFLKLTQGHVESRPIKGTRPRGKTPIQDQQLANELLASEKDNAENIMIVDLLRNDLSRVCQDHSVKVPQLCSLESYATVHHLVSVVTGQLQPQYTAIDLLRATFPGGSITGAPKIRAMEIIAEIEPTRRGPYCGSIGYIGFNGDMDCSITIRTFCIKNNRVTFQAGGAVVADSDPVAEYEETLTKSSALRKVLLHDFADR